MSAPVMVSRARLRGVTVEVWRDADGPTVCVDGLGAEVILSSVEQVRAVAAMLTAAAEQAEQATGMERV